MDKKTEEKMVVIIGNTTIQSKEAIKYLGVIIDDKLTSIGKRSFVTQGDDDEGAAKYYRTKFIEEKVKNFSSSKYNIEEDQ